MAENLQTTEEIQSQTSKAKPRLRKALAVMGVAATFGSASPVMATASGTHEAVTHKHHKTSPPTAETSVQKATTGAVKNFATQIIAAYNQARKNPPYQGVVYVPEHAVPFEPGTEDFYVDYPTGTNIIVNNGKTENIGTGGYRLSATISYPESLKRPPGKINLNNVSDVSIDETLPSAGFGASYLAPTYDFGVTGNNVNVSSQKNQWELNQEISSTAGLDDWSYSTERNLPKLSGNSTPYSHLTMQEFQAETTLAQTFLNNAKQYIVTPITPALEASLPIPSRQSPPLATPS